MTSPFRLSSLLRIAACIALVLSLSFATAPQPAKADPVTIIVTVIVTASIGVYDYLSCDINILWGCDNGNGRRGGGGHGGSEGRIDGKGDRSDRGDDDRDDRGDAYGRGGICAGSIANVCGMTNPGTRNSSGQCQTPASPPNSACCASDANVCGQINYQAPINGSCTGVAVAPPSNALCPAPVMSANSFYAEPTRVRSGFSTTLHWGDIINATACSLSGGGLALENLGIAGAHPTQPITSQTQFSLTCINGVGGQTSSLNTMVHLIPTFQEI